MPGILAGSCAAKRHRLNDAVMGLLVDYCIEVPFRPQASGATRRGVVA